MFKFSDLNRNWILLVFPIVLLFVDLYFRFVHLERYKPEQLVFYVASVLLSGSFWTWAVLSIKQVSSNFWKIFWLAVAFPIFLVFTVGSFTFFSLNGLFPNYYTLLYFKTEPESAFLIVKDSLSLSAIIGFVTIWFLGVYLIYRFYFPKLPSFSKVKLAIGGLIIFVAFQGLVSFHNKYDQCAIVDTNMAMCIQRHLITWDDLDEFKGTGLGQHQAFVHEKTDKPLPYNVLVFVMESVRKNSLQLYGNSIETTPYMSAFKAENEAEFYQFEKTVAASSTTMIAVPSILTGIAAYQDSSVLYRQPFIWDMGKAFQHRTFFLSSHTLKWYHFDRFYQQEKLDHWWNKDNSGHPYFNDLGIKDGLTIEELKRTISSDESPFFGVVQLNTTHYPYKVPEKFKKWTESYSDSYNNSVYYQDVILGDFMNFLKERNTLKNTVIFFVADHGEALMEHHSIGHVESNYAEAIRIPMFAYIPAKILKEEQRKNLRKNQHQLTSGIDLAPTLFDLMGLQKMEHWKNYWKNYTGYSLLQPIPDNRMLITLNNNQIARFNTGVSVAHKNWHYLFRTNIVPYKEEFYSWKNDSNERKTLKVPPKIRSHILNLLKRYPVLDRMVQKIEKY